MKTMIQKNIQTGWLVILAGCLIFFSASFVSADSSSSEMSVEEALLIQGSVRKVLTEQNTIYVKINKEEKMQILIDPQTDFVGLSSFAELHKEQRVKVWYSLVGEKNRAVKVELLPDLGC